MKITHRTGIDDDQAAGVALRLEQQSKNYLRRRVAESCEARYPFMVSAPSAPTISGCYSTAPGMDLDGEAAYASTEGVVGDGENVVAALQLDQADPGDMHWALVFVDPADAVDDLIYCFSVDLAEDVHPADSSWICDLDGTLTSPDDFVPVTADQFDVSCGCAVNQTDSRSANAPTTQHGEHDGANCSSHHRSSESVFSTLTIVVLSVLFIAATAKLLHWRVRRSAAHKAYGSLTRSTAGPTVDGVGGGCELATRGIPIAAAGLSKGQAAPSSSGKPRRDDEDSTLLSDDPKL